MNIKELIEFAKDKFARNEFTESIPIGNSRSDTNTNLLDIEILLSHVLDKDRTFLKTWPDHGISAQLQRNFEELLARRIAGEPIAYIIGKCEIWDFTLTVNRDVLIPRPETEHLIEQALAVIPDDVSLKVADLGTGSGVIACALARAKPKAHIFAIDESLPALTLAKENAKQLNINNISFVHGDWFAPLEFEHDFFCIVSNPPYVAVDDPHLEQPELRFEPQQALVAAEDGCQALRHIINNAKRFLVANGWLLLEHGSQQGDRVRTLLAESGYSSITTYKDFAGHDRVTIGMPSAN